MLMLYMIDVCAGFAFHRTGEGGFGYKISGPAGIFIFAERVKSVKIVNFHVKLFESALKALVKNFESFQITLNLSLVLPSQLSGESFKAFMSVIVFLLQRSL
jgi:hypothetical protein